MKYMINFLVILCRNVAANLTTNINELEHYLSEDTELNKYLIDIFKKCKKNFIKSDIYEIRNSKTLWDLIVIAYERNTE